MTPTVRFDRETCTGFFSCVKVAPNLFLRDDGAGKSELAGGTEASQDVWELSIGDDALEAALEAANVCPVDAIQVVDDSGERLGGPDRLRSDRR